MKKTRKKEALVVASVRMDAGDWAKFGKIANNRSELLRGFIRNFIDEFATKNKTNFRNQSSKQ